MIPRIIMLRYGAFTLKLNSNSVEDDGQWSVVAPSICYMAGIRVRIGGRSFLCVMIYDYDFGEVYRSLACFFTVCYCAFGIIDVDDMCYDCIWKDNHCWMM
jgi:hypothetical protein